MAKKSSIITLLSTAATGAMGAYLLYKKASKQTQKKVRGWTLKARGEILEKVEKLKTIDEEKYLRIVDQTISKYRKLRDVNTSEITKLAKELKAHWKIIETEFADTIEPKKKSPRNSTAKRKITKKRTTSRKK